MGIDYEILGEIPFLDDRTKKTKKCGKGSNYFKKLGPMLRTGSLGQDTVWGGTFWRKTMKNQPGTIKTQPEP